MDHMLHVGNIQTSGSNVCGDQDSAGICREALQTLEPLFLVHVGVEAVTRHVEQAEQIDEPKMTPIKRIEID